MPAIALIRGPHLRPDGIRPWEALAQRDSYDVVAFECDPPVHDTSSVSIRVERLPWPAATLRRYVGADRVPSAARSYLRGIDALTDRFDVLHTSENYNIFSLQAALAARRSEDTTFVFSAGQNIPYPVAQRNPLAWKLKQYVNGTAAGITTTAPLGKRALIHEGVPHDEIRVVPNCVDPETFSPSDKYSPDDVGLSDELQKAPTLLFAHQLCEQKGTPELLDAHDHLKNRGVDHNLVLLGENQLDAHTSRRIQDDNGIYHLECVPYTDMGALYNLAEVFVLPSVIRVNNEEQFGMCALEAMACGVPTIVTNIGGLPFVAEHGETSLVVEERDALALANAAEQLLADDVLRDEYGANARARAKSVFHPCRVANVLADFYDTVVFD